MELSIQERLKDLRVERGLTLEQLEEQVNLSKSALGSYEAKDFKDISHYAIIKLAKFYGVTADYLLGLSQTRNHPNADLADLRLSDDMIELLKSGLIDNSLLCELAVHPDFPRLMADLEIYVNGIAGKQVQSANAIVVVADKMNQDGFIQDLMAERYSSYDSGIGKDIDEGNVTLADLEAYSLDKPQSELIAATKSDHLESVKATINNYIIDALSEVE